MTRRRARTHHVRPRGGQRPTARAVVAVLALLLGAVVLPSHLAGAAGGGAAATVPNGLSTTDLGAVGMSPSSLASALVGPGVSVSNVQFAGANAQAGLIHLVDPAVVSFNDGVILSSGNIADVVGPNKSDGTTGDMAGPDDADLNALIAGTQTVNPVTFDRAVLEFDFVPNASQVYFTYTFGSDEYLEWVNLFNDVFAFYVNGQNCATVPSGEPVSIDTINSAVNPQLFRDNSFSSPPANPINIESDGLSVEMICSAPVNAGQVNHMKLAIADTSDQILDSVVMIKSHTLSTTKPESCNDGVDNDDDTLVDSADDSCTATTTPPPPGSSGIGSGSSSPPFTGNEGSPILLDASALGWVPSGDTVATSWTVTGINGTTGTCDVSPAGRQPVGADGSPAVVTAVCPDDGEYVARIDGWDVEGGASWDKDVDFFVQNAPPSVSIDTPAPGAQATIDTQFDLSATVADPGVSDTVSCTISWGDGAGEAGTVADGACTGSHAYPDAGTYVVSVTATDGAGDSAAAATVVDAVAAGTALASSANPSVKGQSVTLTASTTLGTKGTMRFYDGATLVASRSVVGGTASFTTSALAVGSHPMTAVYLASSTAVPSTSGVLDQQVGPAETAADLTADVASAVSGQAVTLRTTVSSVPPGAGVPTGSVTFSDNGTPVGTKSLSNGVAALVVKPAAGSHSYTATYAGTSSYTSASTTQLDLAVDPAPTTVALTSSVNPSVFGQSTTIRASVQPVAPGGGVPAGTVDIYDGGVLVASKALASGAASVALKPTVGLHTYTAVYGGSADHVGSTSAALDQVVDRASTTVALTSTVNPSVFGQSTTVKAVVKAVRPGAGVPSGTVDIYDGDTLVASKALVSGAASVAVKPTVGTHSFTAVYGGSASFAGSSSDTLDQVVGRAGTTVGLTSSYATTTYGHIGSVYATVKAVAPGAGRPSGTVAISDDGTPLAMVALVSGKATLPLASLSRGTHHLTATYEGDDGFLPSATTVELVVTIT